MCMYCLTLLEHLLATLAGQCSFQTSLDIRLVVLEYPFANSASQFSWQALACLPSLEYSLPNIPYLLYLARRLSF